jgi:hypothetical protein
MALITLLFIIANSFRRGFGNEEVSWLRTPYSPAFPEARFKRFKQFGRFHPVAKQAFVSITVARQRGNRTPFRFFIPAYSSLITVLPYCLLMLDIF